MAKTRCPNCSATISIEKPREGAILHCPACGKELEVVSKDPFRVELTDEWGEDEW